MLNRRNALIAGAATVLATTLPARAGVAEDVGRLLKRHKVPATTFAVVEDGEIVWAEAHGMAWVDGPTATKATKFQAASLSKTFNALTVLALVRDGRLGLDDAVNTHLAGWKLSGPHADSVTVAHLLSHTGATTVHGFAGYWPDETQPTLRQVLDGATPANSAAIANTGRPGRKYVYSGGGTTVLQQMVIDLTGKPYDAVVTDLVLRPLGMTDSIIRRAAGQDLETIAAAHMRDGSYGFYHDYPEQAAAGLWTTPKDLCRALIAIMAAHAGDAGALLPQDLARRMLTPIRDGAALGTFVDGSRFNHTGSNFGFRAVYMGNVRSRSGYAVMSNGENGSELNTDIVSLIRRERGW